MDELVRYSFDALQAWAQEHTGARRVDETPIEFCKRVAASLPRASRDVRVLVVAAGDKAKEAETAGADHVGGADVVKKIQGGWLDFDAVIATPDQPGEGLVIVTINEETKNKIQKIVDLMN